MDTSKNESKSAAIDQTTLEAIQGKYIQIIDSNNRAVENMSSNFESFKKLIVKSIAGFQKECAEIKSTVVDSVRSMDKALETHHYDNNLYSEQLKEAHNQLMTMKETITRFKDESFRVKKINSDLVVENSELKSQIALCKTRKMKDYTSNSNPLPSFRLSEPVITASPSRHKSTQQKCDDTLSDEAIAKALEHDGSDSQAIGSDTETSGPPPTRNPFQEGKQDAENRPPTYSAVTQAAGTIPLISQQKGKNGIGLVSSRESMHSILGDDHVKGDVTSVSDVSGVFPENDMTSHGDKSTHSFHESTDTNDSDFSGQQHPRHLQTSLLLKAETVLVHDSTPKHIDFKRYMGTLQAFSQRSSNSSKALHAIKSFPSSTKVKYATIHEGVNDVTDKVPTDIIVSNLKTCLTELHEKFPNACIAFSEILFIGRGSRDSDENVAVCKVNTELRDFCTEMSFSYVQHKSLQSSSCTLFEDNDDKHINRTGGTAVLVSDIYYGTGFRQPRNQRDKTGDRNGHSYNELRPAQQFKGNVEKNQQQGVNVNHILEMMCMNQRALMSFLNK